MDKIISDFEGKLPKKMLEQIEENLPKGLNQAKIKKILEASVQEYDEAKVTPGESVGIISAESIGEPGTQMTLNTFHSWLYSKLLVSLTQEFPSMIFLGMIRAYYPCTYLLNVQHPS